MPLRDADRFPIVTYRALVMSTYSKLYEKNVYAPSWRKTTRIAPLLSIHVERSRLVPFAVFDGTNNGVDYCDVVFRQYLLI